LEREIIDLGHFLATFSACGSTLISAKLPPSTIDREVNRCPAATFSEELLGSRECDRGLLVMSFEAKRLCPDPRLPICFGRGATRIRDVRSYREAPYAPKPAEKFSRNFRGWYSGKVMASGESFGEFEDGLISGPWDVP